MSILQSLVFLLPPHRLKNFLLRRLGHQISPLASIGVNLIIPPCLIAMDDLSTVGSGNVIRGVNLRLAREASIGSWNWFSRAWGRPSAGVADLFLDSGAALTSRHYLDLTGGVVISRMAILGGHRSTVLTHQINFDESYQSAESVSIGEYSFVGTNATILMGAQLPARSVLGAGSTLMRGATSPGPGFLWVGNPAKPKRPIDGEFFRRMATFVWPRE